MKRLTISLEDDLYNHLQIVANEKDNGRISKTIRNILSEVIQIEGKFAQGLMGDGPGTPKIVTVKESVAEIKKIENQKQEMLSKERGELNGDDYI